MDDPRQIYTYNITVPDPLDETLGPLFEGLAADAFMSIEPGIYPAHSTDLEVPEEGEYTPLLLVVTRDESFAVTTDVPNPEYLTAEVQ